MKKQIEISAMEWFAWGWIGLLLLLSIMNNGIFQGLGLNSGSLFIIYERPLIYGFFITIAVMIWISIHVYQKHFQLERKMIYMLVASLLCLTYVLSSFNAESPILAKFGVFISLMVVVFFIAGAFIAQYNRIVNLLPKIYLIFGYIIVIYGFMNLLGNTYLLDSLSFIDGVRITSIFQYANAYAVMLLTLWIAIIIELIRTPNRWARILHGFMLVPVCVSFLLTLSRGALIVLPIIAIVILLMFKLKQQIMFIVYSALGMGLSLLIYTHLEKAGAKVFKLIQKARAEQVPFDTKFVFSSPSVTSWVYLIGISIIMSALVQLIVVYFVPRLADKERKDKSVWVDKIVPVGLLVVFLVGAIAVTSNKVIQLLPDAIRARVENVNLQTHSVYERLTMYKDAIEIWRENPIIGGGAGSWEALYEQNQSYSYISAQTHGYLTELLVEVGLVGLIIYVGFIVSIFYVFIRFYRKSSESERIRWIFYFIVPITILIHSLIDFEMSYIMYLVLVFLCLGVMTGTQRQPIELSLKKQTMLRVKWVSFVFTSALVLVMAISYGNQLYANSKYKNSESALVNKQPFDQIVKDLDSGLSKSPGHPVLLYQLASLNYQAYDQTKEDNYLKIADRYINKLAIKEPHYRQNIELNYLIKLKMGDREKAINILLEGVRMYPFEQSLYDKTATELLKKWEEKHAAGSSDADLVAKQIVELYEEMKRREQMILELPKTVVLNKKFAVSDTVRLASEKVSS
ncbi:O-antigen ligase family protein [Cohnella luojiensis]|uniref:O-antigen ligase-related domain-containing protein n=1 Tax=Cohnella luojiensis TaxID=652876 RepID=A0A4Y8M216_9BACL|nr:O-antigen ligase family protein [Cohnella luojiensis]TFE28999.1 hypothetical protein E2980_06305 [Cohnella luojiensis]